jgi:hypothetical protein
MLELVLWSCLVAVVPWALGFARKVISGTAGLISPAVPNGSVALTRGRRVPEILCDPSRHGIGRKSSCDPMSI